MKNILDYIVGNNLMFVITIIVLLALLALLIISIAKSLKKVKIPIYEEMDENPELKDVKEEDVIEKPTKKSTKKESKKDKEVVEEKIVVDLDDSKDDTSDEEKQNEEEQVEIEESEEDVVEEESLDEDEEIEENFDDEALREELEKIEDKEIEERIDQEHKKNIEEEIEDNDNEELKELLSEMKDTNEVDPEEVVRNFEEEQEAQSIISYQELVNAVKKRETDYIDELETKPLATVSDFIKQDKKTDVVPEANVLDMIEKLDKKSDSKPAPVKEKATKKVEKIETLDDEEEIEVLVVPTTVANEVPDGGKFKKTDVISPVFGRIKEKNKIDYPKVEKFDRSSNKAKTNVVDKKDSQSEIDETLLQTVLPDFSKIDVTKKNDKASKNAKIEEELKNVNALFEDISESIVGKDKKKAVKEKVEEEEIESLSAVSKNEDFLKALRDFRDSL